RDDLASKGRGLEGVRAAVLAGTGPVGRRVVKLLARSGAQVIVGSRSLDRAEAVVREVAGAVPGATLEPAAMTSESETQARLEGVELVIAAGGAGVVLLPLETRRSLSALRVAIDLNAVPPAGIEGVGVTDVAVERDGVSCHGAIGVGGRKMRIHRAAIGSLFEANDRILDAEEILAIGAALPAS